MDPQVLVNSLSTMGRDIRSDYHLTLGKAIEVLEECSQEAMVVFDVGGSPDHPHSYRGYYSDLAFEQTEEERRVRDVLLMLKYSLDETFEGYKGGDFVMDENTPLWVSEYGTTGRAIMNHFIGSDGTVVLMTKDVSV